MPPAARTTNSSGTPMGSELSFELGTVRGRSTGAAVSGGSVTKGPPPPAGSPGPELGKTTSGTGGRTTNAVLPRDDPPLPGGESAWYEIVQSIGIDPGWASAGTGRSADASETASNAHTAAAPDANRAVQPSMAQPVSLTANATLTRSPGRPVSLLASTEKLGSDVPTCGGGVDGDGSPATDGEGAATARPPNAVPADAG